MGKRGGCFAGGVFFGKNVSDLGEIFILRMLVYFQYFSCLCNGFEGVTFNEER